MTSPSDVCLDFPGVAEGEQHHPSLRRVLSDIYRAGGSTTVGGLAHRLYPRIHETQQRMGVHLAVSQAVAVGLLTREKQRVTLTARARRMSLAGVCPLAGPATQKCSTKMLWTEEELEMAAGLFRAGWSWAEMARALGRSGPCIKRRLWRRGYSHDRKRQAATTLRRYQQREEDKAEQQAVAARLKAEKQARARHRRAQKRARAARRKAQKQAAAEAARIAAARIAAAKAAAARREKARLRLERLQMQRAANHDPRVGKAWRRLEEGCTPARAAQLEGWASVAEMLPHVRAYGRRVCGRELEDAYQYPSLSRAREVAA